MNIKEKLGKKVRQIRLQKGLSQETLANLAGLDRTYIPSIEKGERNISIEVLQKLAKAFGMKISELLESID